MKAGFEKISNQPTNSFLVKHIQVDKRMNFKNSFHYHPELELILTLTSKGRRFIGNHVEEYQPGELILIGKNIPHCWLTNEPSDQIVIQFTEDFLGPRFFETPECSGIRKLFQESSHGIFFHEKARRTVEDKIHYLPDANSFEKLILILEILQFLATTNDYDLLSTDRYPTTNNAKEFKRIHTLFDYIQENYKDDISLDEAANLLNLTKTSLCKFIKRKTKKTFYQIVNEVRFREVTEMLIETNKPIYDICFECGFSDPSYFFKKFAQFAGTTPRQFRSAFN